MHLSLSTENTEYFPPMCDALHVILLSFKPSQCALYNIAYSK